MAKECNKDSCTNPRFGGGFCKFHQYLRTDRLQTYKTGKHKRIKSAKSKYYRIPKISSKLKTELQTYRPIADKYLEENPICEVKDCDNYSNQVHHKKGRVGYSDADARIIGLKLLWDVRFFMACCGDCHPSKIHNNPKWSYENGYLLKK